jgi:hypothetical protein
MDDMQLFGSVPIDAGESTYTEPLLRDANRLAGQLSDDYEVVLLGSIATDKYSEVLSRTFNHRLRFPLEFIGRGDMSRGGLMLRCVAAGEELEYGPLAGTKVCGKRPAKLDRRAGIRK